MVNCHRLSIFSMAGSGVKAKPYGFPSGSLDPTSSSHAHRESWPTTKGWPLKKASNKGMVLERRCYIG